MSKEVPFIVLFTSKNCHACINLRGSSGIPNNESWNNRIIKDMIDAGSSKIIEINDLNKNIDELNIYSTIPDKMDIYPDFLSDFLSDNLKNTTNNSVLRISIKRCIDGLFLVDVKINNLEVDSRCNIIKEQFYDNFVWSILPNDYYLYRIFFNKRVEIDGLKPYNEIFNKYEYDKFCKDSLAYDNYLLYKFGINFDNLIKSIVPSRIKEQLIFIPTFTLVVNSEWSKGKENKPIYYKALDCNTTYDSNSGRYMLRNNNNKESIYDLLRMYWNNRLSLTYNFK
jgi:hypothetical protein